MKYGLLVFCLVLIFSFVSTKINYEVTSELKKTGKANILVFLKEEINFETLFKGKETIDIDAKAKIIVDELISLSEKSQKKLSNFLKFKKFSFKSYWISNSISIENVDKQTINTLSENEEISKIILDKFINEDPLENSVTIHGNITHNDKIIEENMKWIKADKVWKKGHKGKGIIVGLSDSGMNYKHPGIVNAYRGLKKDGTFDHNYNWFDPGMRMKEPKDMRDHGTHCTGSAVGGRKTNRKIGVAPHAKWIHCYRTTTASVHKCLQWLLAPTDLEDKNPKTELRPHVTSHSYRCPGCNLERATQALLSAGVHMVNSAGNTGPRCSTVNDNARFKGQLAIAALKKESDEVTSFSAKGPISGLVKPDVAAPGESIVSASGRSDAYVSKSGTSMSCPTVAGAIAVLWEAVPELKRKIAETNEVIFKSSKHQEFNICNTNGSPNAAVGYGTIDVKKMINTGKQLYGKK